MYMDQDMEGRGIFDHLEIVTTFYNKHYHTKVKKKSQRGYSDFLYCFIKDNLPLPLRQISFLYRPGYTENISKHCDTSLI